MCSDESNFQVVNRKGRIYIKRLLIEKYCERYLQARRQGSGGLVSIWGCFSNKDLGMCEVYNGWINQYTNKNTLKLRLISSTWQLYGRSKQDVILDKKHFRGEYINFKRTIKCPITARNCNKELSKNSATLLTAESVYTFIFESLDKLQTNISKNLSKQIKKTIG